MPASAPVDGGKVVRVRVGYRRAEVSLSTRIGDWKADYLAQKSYEAGAEYQCWVDDWTLNDLLTFGDYDFFRALRPAAEAAAEAAAAQAQASAPMDLADGDDGDYGDYDVDGDEGDDHYMGSIAAAEQAPLSNRSVNIQLRKIASEPVVFRPLLPAAATTTAGLSQPTSEDDDETQQRPEDAMQGVEEERQPAAAVAELEQPSMSPAEARALVARLDKLPGRPGDLKLFNLPEALKLECSVPPHVTTIDVSLDADQVRLEDARASQELLTKQEPEVAAQAKAHTVPSAAHLQRLAAAEAVQPEPLRVWVTPVGETENPVDRVTVRFSRPVTPLASLAELQRAPVPVTLTRNTRPRGYVEEEEEDEEEHDEFYWEYMREHESDYRAEHGEDESDEEEPGHEEPVAGSWQWADLCTLHFRPQAAPRLPFSSTFIVRLAPELLADGDQLAEDQLVHEFDTRAVELSSASPSTGTSGCLLDQSLQLVFNQALNWEFLAGNLRLTYSRGSGFSGGFVILRFKNAQALGPDGTHRVVLEPLQPLLKNTVYYWSLRGLPLVSQEGPNITTMPMGAPSEQSSGHFRTYAPLEILWS